MQGASSSLQALLKNGPLQLVGFDEASGEFVVNEEALDRVAETEGAISIVVATGRYRSGKSYLLNLLANGPAVAGTDGFAVGHNTNACTKGLWLASQPVKVNLPTGEPCTVFFMDSEGFGSTNKDPAYDTRLFALSCLLSSVLIYNSHGSLDEQAIQHLSFVANLSRHVGLREASEDELGPIGNTEDLSSAFPAFFWVLRDFMLELVDDAGNPITPNVYLDGALSPKQGFDSTTLSRNRTRAALTKSFEQRECFTLVRPVDGADALQTLESHEFADLRPEFRQQFQQLRERLLQVGSSRPKQLQGKQVSGSLWAALARRYVKAINSDRSCAVVGEEWAAAAREECEKAVDTAIAQYKQHLPSSITSGGSVSGNEEALEVEDLIAVHERAASAALGVFEKRAVGREAVVHRTQLQDKISNMRLQLFGSNRSLSRVVCAGECAALIEYQLMQPARSGEFFAIVEAGEAARRERHQLATPLNVNAGSAEMEAAEQAERRAVATGDGDGQEAMLQALGRAMDAYTQSRRATGPEKWSVWAEQAQQQLELASKVVFEQVQQAVSGERSKVRAELAAAKAEQLAALAKESMLLDKLSSEQQQALRLTGLQKALEREHEAALVSHTRTQRSLAEQHAAELTGLEAQLSEQQQLYEKQQRAREASRRRLREQREGAGAALVQLQTIGFTAQKIGRMAGGKRLKYFWVVGDATGAEECVLHWCVCNVTQARAVRVAEQAAQQLSPSASGRESLASVVQGLPPRESKQKDRLLLRGATAQRGLLERADGPVGMTCGLWIAGGVRDGGGGRSANLLCENQRERDAVLARLQALSAEPTY
jgi:hypothetical protein